MQTYKIDYTKVIGSGQFGVIYQSTCLPNEDKVCAKVMTSNYFKQSLQNELDIIYYLKRQKHPNIVRILDVDQIEEDSQIKTIIYMEYYKQGNLQQELDKNFTKFDLDYVITIMKQIINGMKFLNENLIIHRDLKPANILLDQGVFKITDFGTSRFVEDIELILKSRAGSPAYASPQILDYQQYTSKTDIYSLGIIFYQLLFNKFPFGDKISLNNIQDFHQRIKCKPFQCPEITMKGNIYDKQEIRQLINHMIQYQESDRIDLNQIFQDRQNDPINSNNNHEDKQFMKLDDLDYLDLLQTNDSINFSQKIEESNIPLLLNSNQFAENQNDSQIKLFDCQIPQQLTNKFDDVFINRHTKQGLELDIGLNLQKFSRSQKIAHVIQIFIQKCNLAQEISQLIKNLDLKEVNQFQIKGLIVAINGYSINLLQNARGFAFDELEFLQSILRVYYEKNIRIAIREFQQDKTPQNEELKRNLVKQIDALYRRFIFDYGQFMLLSNSNPEDRLNGLRKLSFQDSQSNGINAAYSIYMKWINYICSLLPLQKKIYLVNDPKYILKKNLKQVLDLEIKYPFVNIYKSQPDSIKVKK